MTATDLLGTFEGNSVPTIGGSCHAMSKRNLNRICFKE